MAHCYKFVLECVNVTWRPKGIEPSASLLPERRRPRRLRIVGCRRERRGRSDLLPRRPADPSGELPGLPPRRGLQPGRNDRADGAARLHAGPPMVQGHRKKRQRSHHATLARQPRARRCLRQRANSQAGRDRHSGVLGSEGLGAGQPRRCPATQGVAVARLVDGRAGPHRQDAGALPHRGRRRRLVHQLPDDHHQGDAS